MPNDQTDDQKKNFDKVGDEHMLIDGKVRLVLEETSEHVLTSGESHTIDLWLKPQKDY